MYLAPTALCSLGYLDVRSRMKKPSTRAGWGGHWGVKRPPATSVCYITLAPRITRIQLQHLPMCAIKQVHLPPPPVQDATQATAAWLHLGGSTCIQMKAPCKNNTSITSSNRLCPLHTCGLLPEPGRAPHPLYSSARFGSFCPETGKLKVITLANGLEQQVLKGLVCTAFK